MTRKDEYWSAVRVKFDELLDDFKLRLEESIDPYYLYEIRLAEIQELWSFSNWVDYWGPDGPVYGGGHLRFVYQDLVAGKREYIGNPDHIELDAYLEFEKWLSREPTRWSKDTKKSLQNNLILTPVANPNHQVLQVLIEAIGQASSNEEKGNSLEKAVSALFETIPGFKISNRVRTETEEIDISLLNNSSTPPFNKEDPIVLVECKNWSTKCGKNELVLFKEKIENRSGRCSLGFLISWNGFKETVTKEMLRGSREKTLIVPVTSEDICRALNESSFADVLFACWEKAVHL